MEFKGTKGKWVVGIVPEYNDTLKSAMLEVQSEHYWVCKVQNNGMIQSEEGNANAKLIAHAPEMLDFINRISGEMLRNDFVLDEKWYEQAKQIIIRSTTI